MKNKDTKNKELLSKEKQMKVWKAALETLPDCSDAWWHIKSIVATAEFMRDHSECFEMGGFEQEDAPLVVQMLKNMCWDYNHPKPEAGWMLDTVLGMEEYDVSKADALRILRYALQLGVLRELFWGEDENAMFVPSILDAPLSGIIADDLVKEYKNTLLECIGHDYDLGDAELFRRFLEKYLKEYLKNLPAEKLHREIDEDLFTCDLGLP